MSQDDTRQLLIDQALSGAVQQHIRDVIRAAAGAVARLRPASETVISGMRESQLRNVVNVALGATSVDEVAAFILYQMGRSTNSRQWQYGDFGSAVVADLTAREPAEGAVLAAAKAAHAQALATIDQGHVSAPDERERQQLFDDAYIALARQYLGYLNRLFYFADKAKGWDRLKNLTGV